MFAWYVDGAAATVPERIGELRFGRMPQDNEVCYAKIVRTSHDRPRYRFDYTCFGNDGRVLFRVKDYQSVEIPGTR